MAAVGYMRVSTIDQNEARQLADIELNKVFTDKCSGSNRNRPALAECLEWCRDGDTLHVHSIDRLARNLADLQSIVEGLATKGVSIRFEKEGLQFDAGDDNPMSRLMLHMIGAVAEFERSMIRERQREGVAIAKAAGRFKGGKPKFDDEKVAEIQKRYANGEKKVTLARSLGITRPTLDKYLAQ